MKQWYCAMSHTLWPVESMGADGGCSRIYTEDDDHSLCRWVRVTDINEKLERFLESQVVRPVEETP